MPVNNYLTIPPPPKSLTPDTEAERWLQNLVNLLAITGGINPDLIDTSAIDHNTLQNVNRITGAVGTLHLDQLSWDGVTGDVAQLQADLATAEANLTALQASGTATANDITALQASDTATANDIAALQTDLAALTVRVTALETTTADHETRLVAGGL